MHNSIQTSSSSSSSSNKPFIGHADILAFADSSVNLKKDDATNYREQVRILRDKLEKYAADHPSHGFIKTLLSGSLAKGLALKILNDIDVAVYVKSGTSPVNEGELLNWLAERLREAYPQMNPDQIAPDHHAVCVKYAVSGLNVDVVPIRYDGAADDRGYLFTSNSSEPILTSIPLHLAFTRKRKDKAPQKFAQVVRLLKWWARQRKLENDQFKFKSFMIELIVAHLADGGLNLDDFPTALELIFTYIVKSQLKERIYFTDYYGATSLPQPSGKPIEIFDPVNANNNVAALYTSTQRQLIIDASESALDALSEARFATTKGRAVTCWQEILGASFRGNS